MQCWARYCQIPPPSKSSAALALARALPRPKQEPFEYAHCRARHQVAEQRLSRYSPSLSVSPAPPMDREGAWVEAQLSWRRAAWRVFAGALLAHGDRRRGAAGWTNLHRPRSPAARPAWSQHDRGEGRGALAASSPGMPPSTPLARPPSRLPIPCRSRLPNDCGSGDFPRGLASAGSKGILTGVGLLHRLGEVEGGQCHAVVENVK